jgi:hypothetical protein
MHQLETVLQCWNENFGEDQAKHFPTIIAGDFNTIGDGLVRENAFFCAAVSLFCFLFPFACYFLLDVSCDCLPSIALILIVGKPLDGVKLPGLIVLCFILHYLPKSATLLQLLSLILSIVFLLLPCLLLARFSVTLSTSSAMSLWSTVCVARN